MTEFLSVIKDSEIDQAFRTMLSIGVVTVKFTKKDGTERVMKCTTCPSIVVPYEPKTDRARPPSLTALRVWDVEKNEWRSVPLGVGNGLKLLDWQRFSAAVVESAPNSVEYNSGALLD